MNRNVLQISFILDFRGANTVTSLYKHNMPALVNVRVLRLRISTAAKITFNLLVSCILTLESLWTFGAKKGGNHASKHGLPQ